MLWLRDVDLDVVGEGGGSAGGLASGEEVSVSMSKENRRTEDSLMLEANGAASTWMIRGHFFCLYRLPSLEVE
jgi:hypothetical protein